MCAELDTIIDSEQFPMNLFEWAVLSLCKGLDISEALVHKCVQSFQKKPIRRSRFLPTEFKHNVSPEERNVAVV
jgi:hypothetical protein